MAELTPVERSVLVALMAAGGKLRENAELAGQYAIKMTPAHRKKLAGLGLIKTAKSPFVHELTDEGWAFLESEFPTDVPRELSKLGGMNALVEGVRRAGQNNKLALSDLFSGKPVASAKAAPQEKAPPKPADDALSDAAWSDSEEAIAMALQDLTALSARIAGQAKAASDDQAAVFKQLALNADAALQNLRLAARKRDLEALFERGAEVDFDAALFDCFEEIDEGEPALVVKQPVVKHTARDQKIVVLRGLASPAD